MPYSLLATKFWRFVYISTLSDVQMCQECGSVACWLLTALVEAEAKALPNSAWVPGAVAMPRVSDRMPCSCAQ